ncbi:MAG: AAA family ATPase [Thiohalocapsa sp.]
MGLIRGLQRADAYPHPVERVELLETHISWVLLAGEYAYKIKKPVDLGFLDFSTLERRRFFCEEEIRLNRRLARSLYLGVVPIGGPVDCPRVGRNGGALEYAVRMRRFPQQALLTYREPDPLLIDAIVQRIASFHGGLPSASRETPFGTPAAVIAPMRENFVQIRANVDQPKALAAAARLERWTELWFLRLRNQLDQRRNQGFIRECHGDLHRGNIAVIDGEPVIFDCIDFSPRLRWIDTISEFAFLVMDLREAGNATLARRALNRYLELTGDYAGLVLLRFYEVYRAMVRAKVVGIRLARGGITGDAALRAQADLGAYLRLARTIATCRRPRLIIACGLSGSGKTWLCGALSERLPLIHLRSDLERKRLFGLPADARTASSSGAGIYSLNASLRTYARLLALTRDVIGAGYGALVDATFLKTAQREPFAALAAELACPFKILATDAPEAVLRRRIVERSAVGTDASEAGLDVLDTQLVGHERLTDTERACAIELDTSEPLSLDLLAAQLR